MGHESYVRHDALQVGSNRSFGLVFAIVFAIIGAWPLLSGNGVRTWSLIVAAGFVVTAFAAPGLLAPANRAWMRFGALLHRIVSPLMLMLIFALAIVPTGLIMRAIRRDPLRLRRDPGASTYWIRRDPPGPAPESLKDMF
jgi:hypothetical protein